MTEAKWKIGMEVLTDPLRPTRIVHITPTGIVVTEDGRRFRPNGVRSGGGSAFEVLRPSTEEDANIRVRERQSIVLGKRLNDLIPRVEGMIRDMGYGFRQCTPQQSALDRVKRFLGAVDAWEAAEKERGE